jgi:hypothetical protein
MRIIKNTRSAFERQISESVMIQKSRWHNIMNSKSEYNRCAIPRLTTKLGEKDLERWRAEDRLEMEKEASIEEKIRERKKAKSKARGEQNRRMEPGQPSKKRMRLDREGRQEERTEKQDKEILTTTPAKRKGNQEKQRTPKRVRMNYNIRKYITCRRWRDEEEEKEETPKHEINLPIGPPQECSEAFARIGLVAEEVGPKKLKTGENQQPGPAVEPLLGGGEGGDE